MATKLELTPQDNEQEKLDPSNNPSQEHYDQEFNKIVQSPENVAFGDQAEAGSSAPDDSGEEEDVDSAIADHLNEAEASSAPATLSDVPKNSTQQDRETIGNNEESSSDDAKDVPYNPNSKKKTGAMRSIKGMATKRAKMAIAAVAVSVILSVGAFFALLPVKLVHVAENLQERFLSMGQSAVEERSERLMGRYLRKHVLPNVKNGTCKSTVDRNCVSRNIGGNNPASKLFNAWRESNFESKLATEYGVEFYKDGGGVGLRTKAIPDGVNIDDFVDGNSDDLFESKNLRGRNNVRNSYRDAVQDKSRLKHSWNRFKVGTLLEKKYGLKRCVFACDSRDNFADWKDNKKRAFKMALIYRVVEPNSEAYSAIIECLISNKCAERDSDGKTGVPIDETTIAEDNVDNITRKLTQKFGKETAEEIIDVADEILKKGVMAHIIEKLVGKMFGRAAGTATATVASKAVPVVGWIDLAVTLFKLAQNGKEIIAAARFAIIASTAVPTFYLLLSHANEIKSGRVDPEVVESAMASLNPPETDEQGAEISPLFNEIMGGEAPAVSFFNQRAYAADGSSTSTPQNEIMKCSDGREISASRLVCEEESLGISNSFFDRMDDFMGGFGIVDVFVNAWETYVRPIYNLLDGVTGWIMQRLNLEQHGVLMSIPFVSNIMARFADFIIGLFKILFNIPEVDKMSGAQFINTVGAGAAVTGVQSGAYGIGASSLSKAQVVAIADKQYEQKPYAVRQKSLFARLASRSEGKSLISQVALVMPGNTRGLQKSAVNLALNPIRSYSLTLASATSTNAVANGSVYGTQTYNAFTAYDMKPTGVPLGDSVLDADPEDESLFSEEACKAEEERWLDVDNFEIDDNTQYAYPKTINRCRLEKTATCAVGAVFATKLTDLCEEGEQSGASGGGGSSNETPPPTGEPIDKSKDTSKMACAPGASNERVVPVGDGSVSIKLCDYGGVIGVNASWSNNMSQMVAAASKDGVVFAGGGFRTAERQIALRRQNCGSSPYAIYQMSSGSCRPPTARPGTSNHELGLAIDFSGCQTSTACYKWLKANAGKFGVYNFAKEYWHWSYNAK